MPSLVVVVAVPHHVFGRGTLSVTFWVVAAVVVHDASFVKSVRGTDAASYDGLEDSGSIGVRFIFVSSVLFFQVGSSGLAINMWVDSDHVFPVTGYFGVVAALVFGSGVVLGFLEELVSFLRGGEQPIFYAFLVDSVTEVL